jgi:hypothetical protein
MKTQIIRRISLAVIAVLFALNNNGSNMQSIDIWPSSNHFANSILKKCSHNNEINTSLMCCNVSLDEKDEPVIPEPNGDHEFHSFHFHHEKHLSFWKTLVNKILEAAYYVVVVLTYLPFKIFS